MSSGVYVSLLTAPIVRMSKTQEVGVRAGMSMTLVAVGAIAGPPISGAINVAMGGFKFTGVYAGKRQHLCIRRELLHLTDRAQARR